MYMFSLLYVVIIDIIIQNITFFDEPNDVRSHFYVLIHLTSNMLFSLFSFMVHVFDFSVT